MLSAAEAEAIRTRTGELTSVITGLADSYGYAVADIHALFADIKANGLRLGRQPRGSHRHHLRRHAGSD